MEKQWSTLAEDFNRAGIGKQLADIFRNGWHFDDALAKARQQQAAKVNHGQGRRFLGRGIGQVTMSIDPKFYWDMVALFGPDCWKDKGFRKSVLKKNPECRVKSQSDNLTLRVNGTRNAERVDSTGSPQTAAGTRIVGGAACDRVWFKKTYAEA